MASTQSNSEQLVLDRLLRTHIVGQKRTSTNKQFVFLSGKYVLKGPFWHAPHDQERKVEQIFQRSNFFKSWSTPYVVLPLGTVMSDHGQFIYYPNLAEGYPVTCVTHRESFSNYVYNVQERSFLNKLNHAWDEIQPWIDTMLPNLLLTLCHCYILGVGDTGMCNILVDTQKRVVYLIDYDENRDEHRGFTTSDVESRGDVETFYFSKPPGKKFNWVQRVRPYYSYVVRQLQDVGPTLTDPGMIKRYQQCVSVLSQNVALPSQQPYQIEMTWQFESSSSSSSSTTISHTIPMVSQPNIQPNAQTTSQVNNEPVLNDPNDQRRYVGRLGGSCTYHGIPVDISKSGMQKAVRRGQQEWALMYLFELVGLGQIEPSGAILTNTYNRLAVCAAEDVGLAQLDVTLAIIDRVNQRDKGEHKLQIPNAELASMAQLLCASRKTRVCSHIWRSFVDDNGIMNARNRNIDNILPPYYGQPQTILGGTSLAIFETMLTEISRRSYPRTIRITDFKVFTAAWQYLNETQVVGYKLPTKHMKTSLGKVGGWTSDPSILLWEIMRRFVSARVLDILATAYYKQSEKRPFLSLAILCCIYSTDPELSLANIQVLASQWERCPYLNDLANHRYNISLQRINAEQPYVIDKHTAIGKSRGGTVTDFVLQGAIVTNEDQRFVFPVLQELYCNRSDF